jgi:hypothetical protein
MLMQTAVFSGFNRLLVAWNFEIRGTAAKR